MKSDYQILVIGGGTGGIMTSAQLKRKNKKLDIAIIEPKEDHFYQPAWTLVGGGTYDFEKTRRKMASVIPAGVEWIRDEVTGINGKSNEVTTKSGSKITYDYLIVCPGIQINIDGIEGLAKAMETDNVCSNYTDPQKTWRVLQEFDGGNAVFTQPTTPVKCAGATQKIMYMSDDLFRRMGVRDRSNIIFATPGSTIFGVEDFRKTLENVISKKGIIFKSFYAPYKIDSASKQIFYKYIKPEANIDSLELDETVGESLTADKNISLPYDIVHIAPPQRAPDFIRNSGPDLVNEDGWLKVDKHSLQHTTYENIFGVGDVISAPNAKTGAAIRKQAPVVVENILGLINSSVLSSKKYEGYSSCPIVTGYGKMMLAEFKYGNVRDSDPFLSKFMDTSKESWLLWLLKKYGLPFLYWHRMMKGKM